MKNTYLCTKKIVTARPKLAGSTYLSMDGALRKSWWGKNGMSTDGFP